MDAVKPVALIDMDNTVADYHGAMQRDLASLAATASELMTHHEDGKEPSWLKARIHLVRNQPQWWRNLPVCPTGMILVGLLRDMEFEIHVCTKGPYKHPAAWSEKVQWSRHYIPDAKITVTEDKSLVNAMILADDWPPYGIDWLRAHDRGLLVVPALPWNGWDQFPEELHSRIIRFDDTYDSAKALRARLTEMLNDLEEEKKT